MAEPRPTTLTPDMATAVAKDLANDLINAGEFTERDRTMLIGDIARCGRLNIDGYDLASALEKRCHWSPSAAMVEILDNFSHLASDQVAEAQKAWAKALNLTPPFPVGARVAYSLGGRACTGEITAAPDYYPAKYLITEDGNPKCEPPTNSRWVINFEDVRAVEAAEASQP